MRLAPLLLAFATSLFTVGCFNVPNDIGDESTSDATGGTTGGTAADDGSTGEADACPEYCSLVQDLCSAEQAQYTSEAVCLSACADLPPGTPEDQLGNTVGCRRFQAVQASEAPDTFCGAAGPSGDGVCGAQCEVFCGLALSICVGDDAQWPDIPSCLADCMQFPDDVEYNASVVSGDSYACRMYHLTVATLDSGVHCPHIGLASPVCL